MPLLLSTLLPLLHLPSLVSLYFPSPLLPSITTTSFASVPFTSLQFPSFLAFPLVTLFSVRFSLPLFTVLQFPFLSLPSLNFPTLPLPSLLSSFPLLLYRPFPSLRFAFHLTYNIINICIVWRVYKQNFHSGADNRKNTVKLPNNEILRTFLRHLPNHPRPPPLSLPLFLYLPASPNRGLFLMTLSA